MSYVLAVWPQDILQPWPADRDMAQSQLEQAQAAAPPTTHDPRLLAFAHALDARFPSQGDEDDVYDNLPPDPNRDAPEGWLNIGLYDSAERDAAYAHAVVQANDQGLNLFDPQSGDVFLANGVALGLDSPSQCLRAVDAWHRRDLALARAEYRRVAAGRDDQALQGWGLLLGKGQGGPRNHSLGAALMQLGGADADEDPKGYGLALQRLTPSLQQEQARQHEVLQAAADLLAAVDTEIALQETLLQDALRDITNPRLRKQAALVLIRIANNGHAAAAYRLSLEVAFGKSIAGAQDDADHWLRLAARWGDPAAQVSLARQLMKGLNPALDEAEKWLLQAQASGVRGQESLLADLRTKRDELAALPGRAESGEAAAQRQLAQQLMDPTDPTDPQRVAQGMAWLQRAAEQGDAAAAAELGHALAFGRPGVAPDLWRHGPGWTRPCREAARTAKPPWPNCWPFRERRRATPRGRSNWPSSPPPIAAATASSCWRPSCTRASAAAATLWPPRRSCTWRRWSAASSCGNTPTSGRNTSRPQTNICRSRSCATRSTTTCAGCPNCWPAAAKHLPHPAETRPCR